MSDLNWCTFCDNAISQHSSSLYCSQKCLREDALNRHPLLGYKYPEFKNFPRIKSSASTKTMNSDNHQIANKKPPDDQIFRLETVSTEQQQTQQKDANYHPYFNDHHEMDDEDDEHVEHFL